MKYMIFTAITITATISTVWACPPTIVTNSSGQVTARTQTQNGVTTVISTDGRVQGFVNHNTGTITTPDGRVQGRIISK